MPPAAVLAIAPEQVPAKAWVVVRRPARDRREAASGTEAALSAPAPGAAQPETASTALLQTAPAQEIGAAARR